MTDSPTKEAESEVEENGLVSSDIPKKKKALENVTEADVTNIIFGQTIDQVTLTLHLTFKPENEGIDATFTNTDVTLTIKGDRCWHCKFYAEIEEDNSRVLLKGQKLQLKVTKKIQEHWPSYIAMPPTADTSESTTAEIFDKEEEPVYYLDIIKHDFFEREDNLSLHVYVKNIDKDAVKLHFYKESFILKFRSEDGKFLSLHAGTSSDTVFCWKVQTKGELVPQECRHKITSSFLEIILKKISVTRWGGLEALQRKEKDPPKAETWISTKKLTSTNVNKNVAFDEMSNVNENSSLLLSRNKEEKKPTCKVQPLNKNEGQLVVLPGFTGLDNLGNTCFMNSVLQALANTREFRDYFLDCHFQSEINPDNPLGTGGNLAVAFAVMLKTLWSGRKYSIAPGKLKDIVARKASQFTGFAQHDAQEFMAFVLDGLHEDLNRVRKKPYTETIDSDGRQDKVVADESWEVYKKRNDSFVVDLFHGQYRSKLVCPVCEKLSITFDPFLYLSIPLPKKCRLLPVTFMWKEPYKKPVRYMLKLPKDASVEHLKDELCMKTEVLPCHMRVIEAYRGKIHKTFSRGASLTGVQANDNIIVCEVLSEEVAGERVYEVSVIQRSLVPHLVPSRCAHCHHICGANSKLKRCTKCFKVGYCDQACQKNHWQIHKMSCNTAPEPVGCPFIISVPESRATYSKLCKLMEAYARFSVDVFQPPVQNKLTRRPSSSNLSSSGSQSSGSLSSLDSQSSSASTCTLTGEQMTDHMTNDTEDIDQSDSMIAMAGSVASLDSSYGTPHSLSLNEIVAETRDNLTPDTPNDNSDKIFTIGSTPEECMDCSASGDNGHWKSIPTNPVLGVQVDETERAMPLFYIKPVNSEGIGLKGPDGERFDDRDDDPLDLSLRKYLSIDWINVDKLPSYVLVQSKELEADNDESMQTLSSDEVSHITLEQCLELFTEPEVLSPDEAWYCPRCKKHQEATKQMSIWRVPHTLIIQLKRFSFRNFIFRDKIDKMVQFPTRGLDLSKFILGQQQSDQAPPIYDLYAVINHHGGILGGHYTSYVRCADTADSLKSEVDWRLCDDSRVTPVGNEKNVVTAAAYVLFYRQRNRPAPVPACLREPALPLETAQKPETDRSPCENKTQVNQSKTEKRDVEKEEEGEVERDKNESEEEKTTLIDNKYSDAEFTYTDMDAVD
ncbi:ubiquitin carboxyl-terminal hydrolase 19-like [Gigantopelta aegis]|uniref:ubiquitin carboxyl-terminal hydrolase 19-like n=1 Tax=Gigantopelta aegis TaxID=1735272 RepID=UPI001B888E97|nr:ubiquitin carboxyl-terminal hydrolase 19-like [Gigantopelta aegis]